MIPATFVSVKIKVEDTTQRVEAAANKATFRNLEHAAASVRKDAAASIQIGVGASPPGTPPHTHTGRTRGAGHRKHRNAQLKRSLRYNVEDGSAIIGPSSNEMDDVAEAHEFGGEWYGIHYPARPFMGPALERAAPRFPEAWSGTIGE